MYEEAYKEQGGNYRQLRSGKWERRRRRRRRVRSRTNVSLLSSRREEGYRHR